MITIFGELTSLNEYINAERSNRFIGAKLKKENTENVQMQCLSDENRKQEPIEKPCLINFRWFTKNKKKDPDNISSAGRKFILDGLVKSGILKDDTRKFVKGFTDNFEIDVDQPRVEIEFTILP